jgi:Uma2 family endonuclease
MTNIAMRIPNDKNPFADRRHWTADDCEKLETLGILEAGTYELLEGEVVEKGGQNVPHAIANGKTFLALTLVFGADYVMLPVSLVVDPENRPEPDVIVTRRKTQDYLISGNPTASEVRLIIEISDSTLWRDRNTKAQLYNTANMPDYWVLDINNRRLYVYRQPSSDGYADVQEYDETQTVAPLAAQHQPIAVADLLP